MLALLFAQLKSIQSPQPIVLFTQLRSLFPFCVIARRTINLPISALAGVVMTATMMTALCISMSLTSSINMDNPLFLIVVFGFFLHLRPDRYNKHKIGYCKNLVLGSCHLPAILNHPRSIPLTLAFAFTAGIVRVVIVVVPTPPSIFFITMAATGSSVTVSVVALVVRLINIFL